MANSTNAFINKFPQVPDNTWETEQMRGYVELADAVINNARKRKRKLLSKKRRTEEEEKEIDEIERFFNSEWYYFLNRGRD